MHTRTWKYLIAGAGLVATAACADDQAVNSPTMPPTRVSSVVNAGPGCDFVKMKKDARAYFTSSTDNVYDLMQTWSSLNTKGTATQFEAKGVEILAHLETEVGTTAVINQSPATAGDTFLRDVFTCLNYSTTEGQFANALDQKGLFGVRDSTSTVPVISRNGDPIYGAEPSTTTGWGKSADPDRKWLVLYGYPVTFPSFTTETGAAATGYELNTVPAPLTFVPEINAGTCGPLTAGPVARLLHKHGNQATILIKKDLTFCTTVFGRTNQGSGVLAFARRVGEWLAPRPAFASMAVLGGMGGSLGGLSPIGPVSVDGSTVSLTVTQQPTTGSINRNFNPPIQVLAATAGKTPLGGVTVILSVLGNQGSPVTLKDSIATTGNDGVATFTTFQTNKAGGYLFKVTGTFASTPTKADTTAMINVSGQAP